MHACVRAFLLARMHALPPGSTTYHRLPRQRHPWWLTPSGASSGSATPFASLSEQQQQHTLRIARQRTTFELVSLCDLEFLPWYRPKLPWSTC